RHIGRGRSVGLRRPGAAGAGADGHRHRVRDHGIVPGGAAGRTRPYRHRPCRRQGARAMSVAPQHLVIAPILLPLVAGALLLFFDDRERLLKATVSILTSVALLAISLALLRMAH